MLKFQPQKQVLLCGFLLYSKNKSFCTGGHIYALDIESVVEQEL